MKNEKITKIAEKLEKGVVEVYESNNYKNLLNTMSKFHQYSLNNSLLICMQMPTATLVAGYKAWQTKFGRQVRKGEKAIQILAPMPKKFTQKVILEDGSIEEREIKYTKFRTVNVFDISQTDGEALPSLTKTVGSDVEGYESLLNKLIEASPVKVAFEDIEGTANGYYHKNDDRIAIKSGMPQGQTIKTLVHEIAHSLLHQDGGEQEEADRRTKEVQAESVSYVVNNYIGIDTSDYSFGYVAGWSSGRDTRELKASLEVIRKTANTIIDRIA